MLTVICPQCKASISVEEGREFAFCTYCGAKMQIAQPTYVVEPQSAATEKPKLSVSELLYRGFKEIDEGETDLAKESIEEALKMNPEYVITSICSRCKPDTKKPYYGSEIPEITKKKIDKKKKEKEYFQLLHSFIKNYSHDISDIEKNLIDNHNCKEYLKIYCLWDDKERARYVIKNFKNALTTAIIDEFTFNNKNIDMIQVLHDNGISIDDIFDAYFKLAHYIEKNECIFDAYYLPIDYLKRMINLGLSMNKEVILKEYKYGEYGSSKFVDRPTALKKFFREYSYILSRQEKSCGKNYWFFYDWTRRERDRLHSCTSSYECCYRYIKELDRDLPKEQKVRGCYVATCVYGSYDCPEVWTLRRFRDTVLMNTWYGRLFVLLYYAISPKIVEVFGETVWFRKMWLSPLDKIVKNLNEKGFSDTPYYDI